MTKRFVYEIMALTPPKREGLKEWGFGAFLDHNFAMKMRGLDIDKGGLGRINRSGLEMIRRYGFECDDDFVPYGFVEGSRLLKGVNVPGDSCDLILSCSDIENFGEYGLGEYKKLSKQFADIGEDMTALTYTAHNIDNRDQAFCLESLFLEWANTYNGAFNSD